MIFWVAMCSQVEIYCHFIEKYNPCLENRSENGVKIHYQNICKCLPYYTTSHHRMLQTLPKHTVSRHKTVRPGKFSIQTKLHAPSCVFYITNEMQLIQCSLLLSALYMFPAVFLPVIRSL